MTSSTEIKSNLLDRVNSFGLRLDQIVQKVDGAEHRFTIEKTGRTMHIDLVFKGDLQMKDPES
jgi:hypothetical protein